MIKKLIQGIKADYREFITARKRIEHLEYMLKRQEEIKRELRNCCFQSFAYILDEFREERKKN